MNVFAQDAEQGKRPSPHNHTRIARPNHDILRVGHFYVEGLGLEVLYRVQRDGEPHGANDHVDELVMLGWPNVSWYLELMKDHSPISAQPCLPTPTDEDLLVIYANSFIDSNCLNRLIASGRKKVPARNPF